MLLFLGSHDFIVFSFKIAYNKNNSNKSPAKKCQLFSKNIICWMAKSGRRTRGTFMRVLSNKSFSHYRCVEGTLHFSAVAQRLRIGEPE